MSDDNVIDFKNYRNFKVADDSAANLIKMGVRRWFAELFSSATKTHFTVMGRADYGFDARLRDRSAGLESTTEIVLLDGEEHAIYICNTPMTSNFWWLLQNRDLAPVDISNHELGELKYNREAKRIIRAAGAEQKGGMLSAQITFACGLLAVLIRTTHELYVIETVDGSLVYCAMYAESPGALVETLTITFTAAAFQRNAELNLTQDPK